MAATTDAQFGLRRLVISANNHAVSSTFQPGNLLVITFGVLLAWRGGWPIFGFLQGADANWLLVTNLILLAGLLAVPLIFIPRGKLFPQALQEAQTAGEMTGKLMTILDDPVVKWAHRGELVGLLIILTLMVFKPF